MSDKTEAAAIQNIFEAMKVAGVWTNEIPSWVKNYQNEHIPNIWQWLQFIYLPMRLKGEMSKPHYIAPIISPHLNAEPKYMKILLSVIELDAISPTIEKK